jgi:hypothetical protein
VTLKLGGQHESPVDFERAVQIHPTVTELIPTMLGELKPLGEPVLA